MFRTFIQICVMATKLCTDQNRMHNARQSTCLVRHIVILHSIKNLTYFTFQLCLLCLKYHILVLQKRNKKLPISRHHHSFYFFVTSASERLHLKKFKMAVNLKANRQSVYFKIQQKSKCVQRSNINLHQRANVQYSKSTS